MINNKGLPALGVCILSIVIVAMIVYADHRLDLGWFNAAIWSGLYFLEVK